MKLKDLKDVLVSERGSVQSTIVYDYNTNVDLIVGCSVEHAVANYGEYEVKRIGAFNNVLIITVI